MHANTVTSPSPKPRPGKAKAPEEPPKPKTDLAIMNAYDLRDELRFNTPLQKLYEKVFFEHYDLGEAVAKHLDQFKGKAVFDPNPEKS